MLITKDMVGKTVYCLGSQPHRNYHPAKLERVVTKVGRKYIYIDGEQYEPRLDLSTGEFTYLHASFGSSIPSLTLSSYMMLITNERSYKRSWWTLAKTASVFTIFH